MLSTEPYTLSVTNGKRVLVVGGTGSVGRAITRALIDNTSAQVTVFSRDETKQYEMTSDPFFRRERVRFVIGDVRDLSSLKAAVREQDFVFHTAAMKHVPFCEENALEAVRTNVIGTGNLIDAVMNEPSVKKVVVCSTDKACSPTTTMGATKMLQERLIQSSHHGGPSMVCVRLGNLFESRGSVFHLFFKQRASGIITLTDVEMTRFISTLDEVVDTMTYALCKGKHGSIIIRQDKAVKMFDVAHAIAPHANIKTVGIRKNEKLHELLFNEHEARHITIDGDHFVLEHSSLIQREVDHIDWTSQGREVAAAEAYSIVERFADRCGYVLRQVK
jgi:UDP-N-acetylglucosamine 4,6-dehydratase/5-epimerase